MHLIHDLRNDLNTQVLCNLVPNLVRYWCILFAYFWIFKARFTFTNNCQYDYYDIAHFILWRWIWDTSQRVLKLQHDLMKTPNLTCLLSISLQGLSAGVSSNSCPPKKETVFTGIPIQGMSLWGLLVVTEVLVCLALGYLWDEAFEKTTSGNRRHVSP